MEKASRTSAAVILSKTKDGCEKVLFSLNFKTVMNICLCFLFSSASIFSSMSPLGIAFYTSVFQKKGWFLLYLASCVSIFIFKVPSPLIYIAAITLVTAIKGIADLKYKFSSSLIAASAFFVLKLGYIFASGFVFYEIFSLIVEAAVLFLCTLIFEKGWSVVADITKRTYISSYESISSIAFLSLIALCLSSFPSVRGFNLANVYSFLLIFIFSLSGINGEAVTLGVLLGSIGILKNGSLAAISCGYTFGALMASVFAPYGKIACVLCFTIANTALGIIIADASEVAACIYDSLMASLIFMFVPTKFCESVSEVFKKNSACGSVLKNNRVLDLMEKRLDDMSTSFRELSQIYGKTSIKKDLGYEYVISKFHQITSTACVACPFKTECFKKKDSKGYRYMARMLETAFKTGKITPESVPEGFKERCSRTDSFCREFNSVFSVMKTEKMWLAKLNDSRMLISDQLLAVADAISAEKERCISSIDTVLEDNIRSQMDKACIYPKELVAERDSYGDFCISVKFKEIKLRSDTLFAISQIIFDITGKKTNCTSPIRNGEEVSYRFYPARRLTASIGYAAEAKNGERVNGDSFSFFSADGQNLHIILSDGMGSGEKAKEQSRLATELLEKFLRAGFKSDTAVSLINSSLLLRSSKDIFSTVDLCSLNLCSAEALFIKLGAASSYIKTEGKISSITGTSLPAGILRDIEVEKHFLSVTDNSVILLMSDGISDIALKNPSLEGWIEKELENIDTTNPQIIATKIMDKASRLLKNSIHDDMTVIAVSVKKV